MPKGDTLFVAGFNTLAEQCNLDVSIPEGSATLMEYVDIQPHGPEFVFTIRVRCIVPWKTLHGPEYDIDSEAVEDSLTLDPPPTV